MEAQAVIHELEITLGGKPIMINLLCPFRRKSSLIYRSKSPIVTDNLQISLMQ